MFGRHLGLPWTWRILLLIAPHLDLVTVFPPGPHMDLVALVPILGSPGPGSWVSIWTHLENNDSDPYLGLSWICCLWSLPGLIGTWILTYIPGPHLDLLTMVPPGLHLDEVTGSHSDLTWTW